MKKTWKKLISVACATCILVSNMPVSGIALTAAEISKTEKSKTENAKMQYALNDTSLSKDSVYEQLPEQEEYEYVISQNGEDIQYSVEGTAFQYVNREQITYREESEENSDYTMEKLQVYAAENADFLNDSSSNYAFMDMDYLTNGSSLQKLYVGILQKLTEFYENTTEDIGLTDFGENQHYCIGSVKYGDLGLSSEDVMRAYTYVLNDHPLFYFCDNFVIYDGMNLYLMLSEEFSKAEVRSKLKSEIEETVRSFGKVTEGLTSNYEIVKAVHDEIINTADYAYEEDGSTPQNTPYVHSIAGYVSGQKKLVCDGYSKTFAVVLNYLDIANIYITGWGVAAGETTTPQTAHAWNMVQLGNENYYFVDTTWDDLAEQGIRYDYFCLASEMYNTHTLEASEGDTTKNYMYSLPNAYAYVAFNNADGDTGLFADDPVYNVLNDIKYEFSDGVLTFSGRGAISRENDNPEYEGGFVQYKGDTKKIVVNEGITGIGYYAFNDFEKLEEIELPDSLKSLMQQSFWNCTSLKSIYIPGNVSFFDGQVFQDCTSLESVYIDAPQEWSVYIHCNNSNYFDGCTSLRKIEVAENHPVFYSKDGVLFGDPNELLSYPLGLEQEEYIVPEGTDRIADSSFRYAPYLKKVTIPGSVKIIGNTAFENVPELQTVILNDGLEEIADYVFQQDAKLSELELPSTLQKIGEGLIYRTGVEKIIVPDGVSEINMAFYYADKLESVVIGKNVQDMQGAFYGSENLKEILIDEENPYLKEEGNFIYSTDDTELFYCKLWAEKTAVVKPGVKKIANGAFAKCKSIENIKLPKSITQIGSLAFDGCEQLQEISIPQKVTQIGACAFYECINLQKMYIPANVNRIAENAMVGINADVHIYYEGTKDQWDKIQIVDSNSMGDVKEENIHYCNYSDEYYKDAGWGSREEETETTTKPEETTTAKVEETTTAKEQETTAAKEEETTTKPEETTTAKVEETTTVKEEESTTAEEETQASGMWGTCKWKLDKDGVLTISGGIAESLPVASNGSKAAPWYEVRENVVKIVIEGEITFNEDNINLNYLFAGKNENDLLKSIYGFKYLDTRKVSNMEGMFFKCKNLERILDMYGAIGVSKATNTSYMFYECSKLSGTYVSGGEQITDMSYMFYGCSKLTGIRYNLKTDKVTNMSYMFYGCTSLESINLNEWKTGNVTNMNHMFAQCVRLKSLHIVDWDTGNVTDMSYMFQKCYFPNASFKNWNTSNVTNMEHMFEGCNNLSSLNIQGFDTGKVTNMSYMFNECGNLQRVDIGTGFNTENVTDMSYMFNKCYDLRRANVKDFETGKTTNMSHMFFKCKELRQLDLNSFIIKNNTNVDNMFDDCNLYRIVMPGTIEKVDTKFAENLIAGMYEGAWRDDTENILYETRPEILKAGHIYCLDAVESGTWGTCKWKVDGDGTLEITGGTANGLSYTSWGSSTLPPWCGMSHEIKKVCFLDKISIRENGSTRLNYLFRYYPNLSEIYGLQNLDTSNVTRMQQMFADCALTSLDLTNFDTRKVEYMDKIFDGNELRKVIMPARSELMTAALINNVKSAMVEGVWMDATTGYVYAGKPDTLECGHTYTIYADQDIGISISKDNYYFDIYSCSDYQRLENVQVIYAGKTIPVDGQTYVITPAAGNNIMYIQYNGIKTVYDLSCFSKGKINSIFIKEDAGDLSLSYAQASYQAQWYDILNEKTAMGKGEKDANNIRIMFGLSGKDADKIEKASLMQGNETLAATDAKNMKFTVNISKFTKKADIYIEVVTTENKKYDFPLSLTIQDADSDSSAEIDADKLTLTISDNIPLLAGRQLEINVPKLPIMIKTEGDTTLIGLNLKEDLLDKDDITGFMASLDDITKNYEKSNEFTNKKIEEILNKAKNGNGAEFSEGFEISIVGCGESVAGKTITIRAIVAIKAKLAYGGTYIVGGIPIAVTVECDASMETIGDIIYDTIQKEFNGKFALNAEFALQLFAGIGINKILNAGIYGKAALNMCYELVWNKLESLQLTGEAGLYGQAGIFKATIPLIKGTWDIYKDESTNTASVYDMAAVYNSSNYVIDTENYNADISLDESDNYIVENVYNAADPKMINAGDKILMVYRTQAENRTDENKTILMYMLYHPETKTWSTPSAVFDNGTMDWQFDIASDGNNIWIVYQDADEIFDSSQDFSLDKMASHLGICMQKYNIETEAFDAPVTMSDGGYNYQPKVWVSNDNVFCAWVHNDNADYFAQNKENTIMQTIFDGKKWTDVKAIKQNLNSVTGLEIGCMNGKAETTVICDDDNKLETPGNTMFLIDETGSVFYSETGNISSSGMEEINNMTGITWSNGGKLYFYEEKSGNVIDLFGENSSINALTAGYDIEDNVLYYKDLTESGTGIYKKSLYTTNTQSVLLTESKKNINYFDIYGDRLVYIDFSATTEGENIDVISNLNFEVIPEDAGLKIENVSISGQELVNGSGMPVEITVVNQGMKDSGTMEIVVMDNNRKVLVQKEVQESLPSGQSQIYRVVMDNSQVEAGKTYYIQITSASDEKLQVENNDWKLVIDKPEVDVKSSIYCIDGNYLLKVTVNNYSPIETDGKVNITAEDGQVIETKDVYSLGYGQALEFLIPLDNQYQGQVITVKADCGEEYYTYNNVSESYIEEPVLTLSGDIDGNGKVNLQDSALLRRYLAGWDVTIDENAADVDGNGKVNLQDSALLRRYLAGWDVTLK